MGLIDRMLKTARGNPQSDISDAEKKAFEVPERRHGRPCSKEVKKAAWSFIAPMANFLPPDIPEDFTARTTFPRSRTPLRQVAGRR